MKKEADNPGSGKWLSCYQEKGQSENRGAGEKGPQNSEQS